MPRIAASSGRTNTTAASYHHDVRGRPLITTYVTHDVLLVGPHPTVHTSNRSTARCPPSTYRVHRIIIRFDTIRLTHPIVPHLLPFAIVALIIIAAMSSLPCHHCSGSIALRPWFCLFRIHVQFDSFQVLCFGCCVVWRRTWNTVVGQDKTMNDMRERSKEKSKISLQWDTFHMISMRNKGEKLTRFFFYHSSLTWKQFLYGKMKDFLDVFLPSINPS